DEIAKVQPPAVSPALGANAWVELSAEGTSLVVPIRVALPTFRTDRAMAPLAPEPGLAGADGQGAGPSSFAQPAVLSPNISTKNGLPME
ncbi:hypothetical protein, partial [Vibrio cholerae]|uniref:hypothetical protein n=1 Tax=Vibrio cholerae TaxID=666 RepID=UPI001F2E362F